MWVTILLKVVTSETAKTLIALLINKLLEAKDDGITKDLAETMIDAVAKSKRNPVGADLFTDAMLVLKQG